MTLTGWSFWSRHRHITRLPTSSGKFTAFFVRSPPPFCSADPLQAAAAAEAPAPLATAFGDSIEPIFPFAGRWGYRYDSDPNLSFATVGGFVESSLCTFGPANANFIQRPISDGPAVSRDRCVCLVGKHVSSKGDIWLTCTYLTNTCRLFFVYMIDLIEIVNENDSTSWKKRKEIIA